MVKSKLINDIGDDNNNEFKATEDDIKGWTVDQITMFLDGFVETK